MNIQLHTRNLESSGDLQEKVQREVRFALSSIGRQVRSVVVRLSRFHLRNAQTNSLCYVEVHLSGCSRVVASDSDPNLMQALTRAANRARRRISLTKAKQTKDHTSALAGSAA